MFLNLIEFFKITFHLHNLGNDPLKRWKNLECWLVAPSKVRSLFKDSKQTAGCTNFCTETRLHRPVSVRNSVHPAVCLPSLKRERTLYIMEQIKIILENIYIYNVIQLIISKSNDNYLTAFLCQNNSIRIPDEKWQDLTNQNNLFTNKHICLQRNSVHYFK